MTITSYPAIKVNTSLSAQISMTDIGLYLFSQKYFGTKESWDFICHRSNGREINPPVLNENQIKYCVQAGYLTNKQAAALARVS